MKEDAKEFAREAHIDPFIKYRNEGYLEHPTRVAALVKLVHSTKKSK